VPRLLVDLDLAHDDDRFARLFRALVKIALLVILRRTVSPPAGGAFGRRSFEHRHGCRSSRVTSKLPVDKCHEVIGDQHPQTPFSTTSSTTPAASGSTGHSFHTRDKSR
jgi:hypothetical protein